MNQKRSRGSSPMSELIRLVVALTTLVVAISSAVNYGKHYPYEPRFPHPKQEKKLNEPPIHQPGIGTVLRNDDPFVCLLPPVPSQGKQQTANVQTDIAHGTFKLCLPGGWCSCSFIAHDKHKGRYLLLTAAHCFKHGNKTGKLIGPTGQAYEWCSVYRNDQTDIGLGIVTTEDRLPVMKLASNLPKKGTSVWHRGWSKSNNGAKRTGFVVDPLYSEDEILFRLFLDFGDSGSPIVSEATGEVVSTACCFDDNEFYGPSTLLIRQAAKTVPGFAP